MNESKRNQDRRQSEPSEGGISIGDIYFVLFRRKWVILTCALAGILAGGILLLLKPPQYQSEAKLYIRYVVESQVPTASGSDTSMRSPDAGGAAILNTEAEILTSLDLANEVVSAIGAEKILGSKAGSVADTNAAAAMVMANLIPELPYRGSVIHLSFQHPDPVIAQSVLGEIIGAYFKKHAEMHQGTGMVGDFLTEETKRLRAELDETDRQLKEAKRSAGIISIEDSHKASAEFISKVRQELLGAEADLAEHRAVLKQMGGVVPTHTEDTDNSASVPPGIALDYRTICKLLSQAQQKEQDDLLKYPETSPFMVEVRNQITKAEASKKHLEDQYPALTNVSVAAVSVGPASTSGIDQNAEIVKVAALEARTNSLHFQLDHAMADAAKVDEMETPISDLQRRKEVQEANLRRFLGSLEQSQIDRELGVGSSGNISIVQSPSPPIKARPKSVKKKVAMAVAGGFGAGLAFAFLMELLVDRTIKRSVEVEKKLHLPLFISIPDASANGSANGSHKPAPANQKLLANGHDEDDELAVVPIGSRGATNGNGIAPWDRRHALHRFYEGLRDRLIVNFEVRNLTHSPKLVAVTSCHKGAGVSTIAAGLAASLSETGDGNVLLVDMNFEQGAAQQFYKGKPGCGLEDALETETRSNALVEGNLYVATERVGDGRLPRVVPRRFANLMPKLKASDYDYIIFDMPPVSQTSVTPRLAQLMDMVLLVIEAEKTNQDVVKQAKALLAESRANVSAVLNKTHTYVPKQLHQDVLND